MLQSFDTSAINRLIHERRSVYPPQYSGKKVDDKIINQMLENANCAPNHKKTAPWRFTIFTDDGLKQLALFQSELYKKKALYHDNYEQTKFDKLATMPMLASHVIAIGMKRNTIVPEIEEIEAVACAVQNMYLTATAYNVGCYWGSGGITYMEEAKAHFALEAQDKLLGFLYIGAIKSGKLPTSSKPILEDKIHWVRS